MILELTNASEMLVVALCLLGECEGEPYTGKALVSETILNRAKQSNQSLKAVCLAPKQYSCFNTETQQKKLIGRTAEWSTINSPAWKDCIEIAKEVCREGHRTTTPATHYYAPARLDKPPMWASKMRLVAVVGNHEFYEEIHHEKD